MKSGKLKTRICLRFPALLDIHSWRQPTERYSAHPRVSCRGFRYVDLKLQQVQELHERPPHWGHLTMFCLGQTKRLIYMVTPSTATASEQLQWLAQKKRETPISATRGNEMLWRIPQRFKLGKENSLRFSIAPQYSSPPIWLQPYVSLRCVSSTFVDHPDHHYHDPPGSSLGQQDHSHKQKFSPHRKFKTSLQYSTLRSRKKSLKLMSRTGCF